MEHKHALIKGFIKTPPNEAQLKEWLTFLVQSIDMKIMMGPYVQYLDVEGNRGVTGVVVIETSHCSVHIWDEQSPALIQMDVYSCKEFDPHKIINCLLRFGLESYDILTVDRNEKLRVI